MYDLKAHIVWATKYRKRVLKGEVQERCRDLIVQVCEANDIRILKGVESGDHVHLHLSYPAKESISNIVRKIKGRSGRKLLDEYKQELKHTYWGRAFLGDWVWSMVNRKCYGRDDTRVFRTSSTDGRRRRKFYIGVGRVGKRIYSQKNLWTFSP